MEPHSSRYSDTPPGSPKSCMKGSRKLTFEKPAEGGGVAGPSPCASPKKSPRSVSIRMHDDGGAGGSSTSPRVTSFDGAGPVQKKPPEEIKFQFQLTEHFDQSTPPPNCTSNGNYEYDKEGSGTKGTTATSSTSPSSSDNADEDDPRKDPQLVEIATKFVNDIIEKAKVEAANRTKAEQNQESIPGTSDRDSFSNGMGRGATNWYRRAHGMVSKWITNICVKANTLRADLK